MFLFRMTGNTVKTIATEKHDSTALPKTLILYRFIVNNNRKITISHQCTV